MDDRFYTPTWMREAAERRCGCRSSENDLAASTQRIPPRKACLRPTNQSSLPRRATPRLERLRMGNSMKNLAVTVETKQTSAERKAAATLVRDAGLHTPLNPDPNVRCSGRILTQPDAKSATHRAAVSSSTNSQLRHPGG